MKIRLVQIDGKLPNLALMKLSSYHKMRGDQVILTRHVGRELFDEQPDKVYASTIFKFSKPHLDTFISNWPEAVIGGTGSGSWVTLEDLGIQHNGLDYSIYPDYTFSLGFSQRGCRLKCGFCVVPKKEGAVRVVARIADIWRGPGHEKKICLLDNDFFGQPKEIWRERIAEIRGGEFKVCFNQGLNVRLIDQEACAALATIPYYDDQFKVRRLYTAWDNLKDERIFFRGVDMLETAGIPPRHLMVYMLMGYDADETAEWNAVDHDRIKQKRTRLYYRYAKMVERRINVYPMVFDRSNKSLCHFQRYVICKRFFGNAGWEDYRAGTGAPAAKANVESKNSVKNFSGP